MEILFLTLRKSSITLVLKHHPSAILYNSWVRICICNILWLMRCMNGFLKSFMTKKCFMRLSYAWACPSLPMERVCFTMKYLSICYFLNNVCRDALWRGEYPSCDHSSTPADLWVTCLFTLNTNTAPPFSDQGTAKKPFIPVQSRLGRPYSTVGHDYISCVCVDVFLYLYPCENLSCVPIPCYLLSAYSKNSVLIVTV